MWIEKFLFLQLCFRTTVFGFYYSSQIHNIAINTCRSAGGYKDFSDYRVVDTKAIEFQKREVLDLETIINEESLNTFKSGTDLRKERNRNLKAVKRDQKPATSNIINLGNKISKKSENEIDIIINSLNEAHQMKISLSSEEEAKSQSILYGVIDWIEFDKIALNVVTNYSEISVRNKTHNWTKFHIRKGDISFSTNEQIWSWIK